MTAVAPKHIVWRSSSRRTLVSQLVAECASIRTLTYTDRAFVRRILCIATGLCYTVYMGYLVQARNAILPRYAVSTVHPQAVLMIDTRPLFRRQVIQTLCGRDLPHKVHKEYVTVVIAMHSCLRELFKLMAHLVRNDYVWLITSK